VAATLQRELRKGDLLYRYGGEEFLVVFPEQTADEAGCAADRMRTSIEALELHTPAGYGIVTISIGVAELAAADRSAADWMNRADQALYRAKARGRNCIEVDDNRSVMGLLDKEFRSP
jgi:diguanylate cyclase (GGDEF)-like protein